MPADRGLTRLAALAAALLASPAAAAPLLDPLIADHAVFQRDRPIVVRGSADAGERLAVRFAGAERRTRADRSGRWSVTFPARAAGGPYRIEVGGAGNRIAAARDVLVGDVWLCSGQSNMEFPVRRSLNGEAETESAADERIRVLTIAQKTALSPRRDFAELPRWQVLTSQSAAEFSAACYFMARDLRIAQPGVPLGLIDASWGGTRIRAWMDEESARTASGPEEVDLLALHRRDPVTAASVFGDHWGRWWRGRTGDSPGAEPWRASDRLAWKAVPQVGPWDQWPGTDFAAFNGGVWMRQRLTLTAAEAAAAATLSLGVIDDLDQTFVNGVGVGSTFGWAAERDYRLAPGVLRAGTNEILVYIGDSWGYGGFQGPADKLRLTLAGGRTRSLGQGWEYSVVPAAVGEPPRGPWDTHAGIGTIYNAMIAPLGPVGLRGVAWYQGESDVGVTRYDQRLAALMAGWRRQFGQPRLPFLVVGLAGFGTPASSPAPSGWAQVQDDQRRAVAADRAAALVPALDLGERGDIHPPNKQEVGRRLALAARALAGGDPKGRLAPRPVAAVRTADGVRVDFTDPLRTISGARALAVELCGAAQASCRFADARATGRSLLIRGDGAPVTRVRYAWSDFAVVNLYADDLPVPTFELPVD